jgi:C-terminal peptidase prc
VVQVTPAPAQLRVFEDLWETVRENYLYEDFNGLDWEVVHDEYRRRVEAGLTPEGFYAVMGEMIDTLGDEHSTYLSPLEVADEEQEFAGQYNYVGIGVLTTAVEGESRVTVIVVFPGSPAEEAGIQPHDRILAVEGQPVLEGETDRRLLLRGEEGDPVTITVQTPGGEPRQITLTRRRVLSSVPVPYTLLESEREKRIGYILLATFADETIDEGVEAALKGLAASGPLDGLILDNRQNTGGLDTVTRETLGFFTSGVVGYFTNRERERAFNIFGRDVNGSLDIPLAVLVGKNTASFGEIFSGILQDIERATIVGELTDGNVEILWSYDFEDGSRIWLAHDTFRPLNDTAEVWEQTGILPDLTVSANWDDVILETDPVVKAAQELLEGGENP